MAKLILKGGNIAWDGKPGRGGHIMFVLQWLEGLRRLGHEVLYYDELIYETGEEVIDSTRLFARIMNEWSSPERCALLKPSGESVYGLKPNEVERFAKESSAIITLGCTFSAEPKPWLASLHPRILIEQDPGFSHIWASTGNPYDTFGNHDVYFTVRPKIGTSGCTVPTFGIAWLPIWNPVILDWWNPEKPVMNNRFTTVAGWWGNEYQEFDGKVWGPKAEEIKKFIELPTMVGEKIEIALETSESDKEIDILKGKGWQVVNPSIVTADATAYQKYISESIGEFSCAKGLYVGTQTGWFSDRSACYLASGRPVVVQGTGFQNLLPIGTGLFSVNTVDEAAEAIKEIRRNYKIHSEAARLIAAEFFSYEKALSNMLEFIKL